jgi:hypothetical protein
LGKGRGGRGKGKGIWKKVKREDQQPLGRKEAPRFMDIHILPNLIFCK